VAGEVVAETARYLYAVCRELDPVGLRGRSGLGGQPLEAVGYRDLVGVVSSVGLEEYGEDALKRNLERLDWLEQTARTHDEVVHAVAARAPTAPMRLATIFLDDEGVVERMSTAYDGLSRALDRVTGRDEWSVKAIVEEPSADSASSARPASGVEYLRQKKAQAEAQLAEQATADETADAVHQRLASLAVARRLLPAQDPRLTGRAGTMVLNAAYLVASDEADRFLTEVEAARAEHPDVVLECQGPWPPYSFATLEAP
jgi:hypothetical protein